MNSDPTTRRTPPRRVPVPSRKTPVRDATPGPARPQAMEQSRIAQRAYELYEQRGRLDGRAMEDWLSAECELRAASIEV